LEEQCKKQWLFSVLQNFKQLRKGLKMNTELKMYGINNIDQYIENVKQSMTYRFSGGNMIVAGLMSDAQEQMAMDDVEGARKTLNLAKNILFQIMEGQLVGNVKND